MKNFITKLTSNLGAKTIFRISILAIVDLITMAAPFYLKYIIPGIHEYLGVTQSQFDRLSAALGWVVLATQIPGGWLADKVSNKKMLITSLMMTAILSLWWTLLIQTNNPSSNQTSRLFQLYLIYIGWGISTTFLFWTPLWKLLSQQGDEKKQGTIFGLHGAINGLGGLIFIVFIGTIVTYYVQNSKTIVAFFVFSYMLCFILLLMAILVMFFFKEKIDQKNQKTSLKEKIKDLIRPMKNIRIWLLSIFVLGMYMFQSVFAYYMKEMLQALGFLAMGLVILSGFRSYGLRMLVSSSFGKWADRRKSYILTAIWSLTIGLILAIVFTVMPGFNGWFTTTPDWMQKLILSLMTITYLLVGVFSWFLVAIRYVQVIEIPIAKNSYASSIAIISFVAFSVDAWFYQMASSIAEAIEPGVKTYSINVLQIILSVALVVIIIGLICGTIVFLWNKKELKKLNKTDYRWRKLQN